MSDWSRFDPLVRAVGYRATKQEANEVLSSVGNPVTGAADETLYFIFDSPLDPDTDYLVTVDADKQYGITSPSSSRKSVPHATKLYFTLKSGKQTDFVNQVKCDDPENGKLDLSTYQGKLTMRFYRTDKQQDGVYPTGLVLLKEKAMTFAPAK